IKNVKKRIKIANEDNTTIRKYILKVSFMNTSTRIFGSIIYFFEPIIFTKLMLSNNVSLDELTIQYGTIHSYVFPLLLLPSFLANCISMYMLPKLSYKIEMKNYNQAKKTFILSCFMCFIIGFAFVFAIYLYPSFFLHIVYGKVIGVSYIKKYGLFVSIFFLQFPFHIALIAFDKEKMLLAESIVCNIIRLSLFFILIPLYQTDGMIIAIIISNIIAIIFEGVIILFSFIFIKNKNKLIFNK
ncbi:MAG: hypothetical protein MR270_06775, partial [Erysipelotrichaceae bacterium]|nr:hypothetical protein [Erysipelotrichaceae bacterium]